jgi:drug/metabolite transporter (DMT)-like permease
VIGVSLFGEMHGLLWWSGMCLLLCGAAIISTSQSDPQEARKKE